MMKWLEVKPSDKYKFMIIRALQALITIHPMRIYVEEHYVRAAPGGVGYTPWLFGNYGAAYVCNCSRLKNRIWPGTLDRRFWAQICAGMRHYERILHHRQYGHYAGLEQGTIPAGIRHAIAVALKDMGFTVEERDLYQWYHRCLPCRRFIWGIRNGTAATISLIKELKYKISMKFDIDRWRTARNWKTIRTISIWKSCRINMAGCINLNLIQRLFSWLFPAQRFGPDIPLQKKKIFFESWKTFSF